MSNAVMCKVAFDTLRSNLQVRNLSDEFEDNALWTDKDKVKYGTRMKKIYGDNSDEFMSTFHVPLGHFWNPVFGFDIVRFDERAIKPPDGTSLKQHIKKRYGENAVNLIDRLIS